MNKTDKEKKDKGWLLGLVLFASALIGAWFFSKIQINVKNDAKGFDGDSVTSVFGESDIEEKFFSWEEILTLSREVRKTSEKLGMHIMIYAGRIPMSDNDVEDFADSCYDKIYGEDSDGVFFYIDMSGKTPAYDYISTSGKAVLFYEQKKDNIIYALDEYLPPSYEVQLKGYEPYRQDIKNAVIQFLKELEYYAESFEDYNYCYQIPYNGKYIYYNNGELFVTTSRPPKQKFYLLLGGLIFGFIVAQVLTRTILKKYRFIGTVSAGTYISNDGIKLETTDTFIREYTARHYNPRTSSSGGSHGGGGRSHSTGGSHGGGGHHR